MAVALKDMSRSPKEAKAKAEVPSPAYDSSDSPMYPYGLCLSLCDDEMAKLGIDENPDAGDEVMLVARAKVTDVSSHQSADGASHRRIELQITHMNIADPMTGGPVTDDDSRQSSRYGGG